MDVKLSRDSVAAGDDTTSHDVSLEIDGRHDIVVLLGEIVRRSYLPSIHGGRSTWVVRTGRSGPAIAVMAAQWPEPSMLVGGGTNLADLGDTYHFEYLGQEDPQAVADRLRAP